MQHGSLDVLSALLLTLLNRAKPLSHLTLRPRGHSGHQYLSQTPYAIRQAYLDRSARGLKPRFVKVAAPTDAEVAEVIATISQRVIRKLQKLRYLEADIDAAVATGYDPLADDEPELARTLAASVKQRIAFGARAGQQVRRIGSGFGYAGERPILTGPRCASMHGFSLHANTHIPAHRRDQWERLMRYTARGSVSLDRLEEEATGDLIYTFTTPWSDGTTGIKLSPVLPEYSYQP